MKVWSSKQWPTREFPIVVVFMGLFLNNLQASFSTQVTNMTFHKDVSIRQVYVIVRVFGLHLHIDSENPPTPP